WLYVHDASPLLIRNLPLGRIVKPSALAPAGAPILTGPLTTAPVVGFSPKTCSGDVVRYPVRAYKTPPENVRSWMPVPGRGFGRLRVSLPPAPPLNGATRIASVAPNPSASSV